MEPIRRAGGAVAGIAARPALEAATALLELVNAWTLALNDAKSVESRQQAGPRTQQFHGS
jgi:hypothetical protein